MSGPRTTHKHADVIHAWADGAVIQSAWTHRNEAWSDDDDPRWFPAKEYRVKPATLRYRVALLSMAMTVSADNEVQAANIEQWSNFQRWLGDWQEVEL